MIGLTVMPGIAAGVRGIGDVLESDGSHPSKAGPCASFAGFEDFNRLRKRMDGCLTGARLAKDRAAEALTTVVIPEGSILSGSGSIIGDVVIDGLMSPGNSPGFSPKARRAPFQM